MDFSNNRWTSVSEPARYLQSVFSQDEWARATSLSHRLLLQGRLVQGRRTTCRTNARESKQGPIGLNGVKGWNWCERMLP